jgi:hypothetical protein
MSQVYRQTLVGEMLVDAVRELQEEGKLTEEQAEKVMEQVADVAASVVAQSPIQHH